MHGSSNRTLHESGLKGSGPARGWGVGRPCSGNGGPRNPKDPAVLKIVRVVNSLRVVFLVRRGDLLSRRTVRGHTIFLGITDIFPLKEGSMV